MFDKDDVRILIEEYKANGSETLNLNDCNLTEIPAEVFELKNLKGLRLKKNRIKTIPPEIVKLTELKDLNLIDNLITELPPYLFDLKSLSTLQLRKNHIKIIPDEIVNLNKLNALNIADNQIEEMGERLGELKSLTTLYLKKNKIKRLPKSFGKLVSLKSFNIEDNPIEYPSSEIVKAGLMRIMIYLLVEQATNSNNGFSFQVPNEMKVAVKQYLIYFQEYVEIAKGKKIIFEVRSTDDGIFIETSENEDIEEINLFFNEYLGFVKSNIDDLNPDIKSEISVSQKELFVMELKQQIHHLRQQLELKNFQLRFLEKQMGEYYNLLTIKNSTPNPIFITTTSSSTASAEAKSEVNIEISVEIPKLQKDILELKNSFNEDISPAIKTEIELIDKELLETDIEDIESVDKKPFKRIKRIFDQLGDEESEFNKAVEKSKNIKESLQKLGKTYNKIAPWLILPSIPNILLDI